MQVKSQEIISELENRIRGAKYTIVSKQITQNADSQEYPWQFESHIEFPIQSPGLKRFTASSSSPSDRRDKELESGEGNAVRAEKSETEKLGPETEASKADESKKLGAKIEAKNAGETKKLGEETESLTDKPSDAGGL